MGQHDPHKQHIGPMDSGPWEEKAKALGEKVGAYDKQRAEGGPFGFDQQVEYKELMRQTGKLIKDAENTHQSIGREVKAEWNRAKDEASKHRDPPSSGPGSPGGESRRQEAFKMGRKVRNLNRELDDWGTSKEEGRKIHQDIEAIENALENLVVEDPDNEEEIYDAFEEGMSGFEGDDDKPFSDDDEDDDPETDESKRDGSNAGARAYRLGSKYALRPDPEKPEIAADYYDLRHAYPQHEDQIKKQFAKGQRDVEASVKALHAYQKDTKKPPVKMRF